MPLQDEKPRPWREVAEDLAQETDPAKIMELSDELNEALQPDSRKHGLNSTPG